MKVLVTGDRGYVGSVLVPELIKKNYEVFGYDIDYYKDCDLYPVRRNYTQITKDIRKVSKSDLLDVDYVIHLAGLSNDPLGELAENLTEEINFTATVNLGRLAKEVGIKRFVYASSQSMYGISNPKDELDEDNSEKNPLTAYAKTKWEAEVELKKLSDKNFSVTCLRPSTVFGISPRFRGDIIFNNLVACAFTTRKIEIKSDGTPWRPVIHVKDLSQAFIACLEAPLSLVQGNSFNVGIMNGNYTVRDLAETVKKIIPESTLLFTGEHGNDSRTYKVSFKKILTELKDYYKPKWNLITGGNEMIKVFEKIGLSEETFRGDMCTRLKRIQYLLKKKEINRNLEKLN